MCDPEAISLRMKPHAAWTEGRSPVAFGVPLPAWVCLLSGFLLGENKNTPLGFETRFSIFFFSVLLLAAKRSSDCLFPDSRSLKF